MLLAAKTYYALISEYALICDMRLTTREYSIAAYKRALESAKVNVVGASRSYVIMWYLLPQTCTRVQSLVCPHVHHALACVHAEIV